MSVGSIVDRATVSRWRESDEFCKLGGMARRALLFLAVGLVAFGIWLMNHRPLVLREPKPASPAKEPVAIQDGKTIDFSSGQAVVKDDAKEKAALQRSLSEIEAATANVTFEPKPAPANSAPAKK